MGLLGLIKKEVIDIEELIPTHEPKEEWIWVDGYKGTNKNMICRDFKYELNKQFDMPEDAKIEACHSGFHFNLYLADTFDFYNIGNGNRFFKVKALVRKSDFENYKHSGGSSFISTYSYQRIDYDAAPGYNRKLAAKSIILTEEVPMNSILKDTPAGALPDRYKSMAIEHDIGAAIGQFRIDTLVGDGYSLAFAYHIVKCNKYEVAHAVGTQKDLSMDMKVLMILAGGN